MSRVSWSILAWRPTKANGNGVIFLFILLSLNFMPQVMGCCPPILICSPCSASPLLSHPSPIANASCWLIIVIAFAIQLFHPLNCYLFLQSSGQKKPLYLLSSFWCQNTWTNHGAVKSDHGCLAWDCRWTWHHNMCRTCSHTRWLRRQTAVSSRTMTAFWLLCVVYLQVMRMSSEQWFVLTYVILIGKF